jgi:hypothetical protein
MKRLAILMTLIALMLAGLFAASQAHSLAKSTSTTVADAMTTAQQFYDAGRFSQAAQSYQQLVDNGAADSALFYNLGNAYFKQGDPGRAILNYRRAQQLAPRDAEIAANLALARAQVAGPAVPESSADDGILNLGAIPQRWFTLNELAVVALALWVAFVALALTYTGLKPASRLRRGLRLALIVVSVGLVIGVVGLGARLYTEKLQPAGVVVAAETALRPAPGSPSATDITLTSGVEIDLLQTRGSWSRVALPDSGAQGWVPAEAVASISL